MYPVFPHENDVLMGRGGKAHQHTGNEKLRMLARQRCEEYQASSKKEKSLISRQLVQQMRQLQPPARFLKRHVSRATWEDVGDDLAREKASQVLRDAMFARKNTMFARKNTIEETVGSSSRNCWPPSIQGSGYSSHSAGSYKNISTELWDINGEEVSKGKDTERLRDAAVLARDSIEEKGFDHYPRKAQPHESTSSQHCMEQEGLVVGRAQRTNHIESHNPFTQAHPTEQVSVQTCVVPSPAELRGEDPAAAALHDASSRSYPRTRNTFRWDSNRRRTTRKPHGRLRFPLQSPFSSYGNNLAPPLRTCHTDYVTPYPADDTSAATSNQSVRRHSDIITMAPRTRSAPPAMGGVTQEVNEELALLQEVLLDSFSDQEEEA